MHADIGSPPVLDGRTGRLIEVDGEEAALVEPVQPPLIEVGIGDLLHALVSVDAEIESLAASIARLKGQQKKALARREAVIEDLKAQGHDGVVPLPFSDLNEQIDDADDEDAL